MKWRSKDRSLSSEVVISVELKPILILATSIPADMSNFFCGARGPNRTASILLGLKSIAFSKSQHEASLTPCDTACLDDDATWMKFNQLQLNISS